MKAFTNKEVKDVGALLREGLATAFPNPDRVGCPPATILRKLAAHQLPIAEADPWLEHLRRCSDCYRDFRRLSDAGRSRQRMLMWAGIAAMFLIVACLSFVYWKGRNVRVEAAIIDLRQFSLTRGDEVLGNGIGAEHPIEVDRRIGRLTIMLPAGSREGQYELGILRNSGEEVLTTPASAMVAADQSVTLTAGSRLSKLEPGSYLLAWRRAGMPWSYHPIILK